MVEVRSLSTAEFLEAAIVGTLRQVINMSKGVPDRYGFKGDAWGVHIEGACAEKLVARETKSYWIGALNHKDSGADAGPWGVRHTPLESGSLLLHPADADDRTFILVVGLAPYQRIVGHIKGAEGKLEEFWRTDVRHPAFFVPQSALEKWRRDS